MMLRIPVLVAVVFLCMHHASGKKIKCGKDKIDDTEFLCCKNMPTRKSYGSKTKCCDTFGYVPSMESCCDGMINPGFGESNSNGKCCGLFSYDKRCYSCKKMQIQPNFDPRLEICCDGNVSRLETRKTCCCGKEIFDPSELICCDGKMIPRPKKLPKDCCDCGFTRVDIGILLDSSESIGSDNWGFMLDFTKGILQEAEIDNDNVRAGVGVYRHNWTMEATMDRYHKKKELFDHIDKIRYVRGSTNTGLGIEMMRKEMFIQRNGDRPHVQNIMIVVTDGDSDEPVYTAAQAKLARGEGIHIFAIGIGLNSTVELDAIASPPASENVFSIANFDKLAELRGRIFASICTGTPVVLIHEPCGDGVYDPFVDVCCNGNPQPKKGSDTKCCDTESYDNDKEMCCDDTVTKRKGGKNTVCCGKTGMDSVSEHCCDGNPVPKTDEDSTSCCGGYAYNDKKDVCCMDFVNPGFGENAAATDCCGPLSYDTRCYECVDGRILPLFDPTCQICCDGVVHNMTLGLSCCCGKEIFKPVKKICCDGKLRKRKKAEKKHECCECGNAFVDIGLLADSSESVGLSNWERLKTFMADMVKSSDMNIGATRFSLVTYRHNFTKEFFFNTYMQKSPAMKQIEELPYIRGSTNTADGIKAMHEEIFTEKNGDRPDVPNYMLVITDGLSDDPAATREQADIAKANGIHIIVVGIGLGVTQELKDIASSPWKEYVYVIKKFKQLKKLKAKVFKSFSDICPRAPIEKKKKPCGDGLYDPKTEVCCNGSAQPIREELDETLCCEQVSYNAASQICCEGVVGERVGKKRTLCCKAHPFDPKDSLCCYNTTVLPKSGNKASKCCGQSTYDPITELCCEDESLYENYGDDGEAGACCPPIGSYDTRCYECDKGELFPLYDCAFQRCCDGVISNVTSDTSCCCGKKAFDPTYKICCDKKLKKRKPGDSATCCECASNLVDIVILLDSSESVQLSNWLLMVKFVEDLITRSDVDKGEVRYGLVMYRHNVTEWFKLNRFNKKADMLESVNGLPYIRGSTNTGGGIEEVRTLFNPKYGDRPRAPNYLLLVTDGDSDDRAYTIEQATKAKAEGIFIIALGIGIRDMSELEAVASEPVEDNAIQVENFDDLRDLEERLFHDLASSVCPLETPTPYLSLNETPQDRCKTPCGDHRIDNRTEICCHDNPQKRMAGMQTKCCDTIAYDPDCLICCEDFTLVSRFAGEYTECCCRFAYDNRTHICCGNSIYPKIGGDDYTACCHNTSYDTRTHVCCDMMSVQPNYGEGHTECCGQESYDSRCYECINKKKVVPLFNKTTELCCAGVIKEKEFGEKSCCCGKEQFDVDTHICCNDVLSVRPKKKGKTVEVTCCGTNAFDPKKKICCDEKINMRLNGYETMCCGKRSYHPDKTACCEGQLNTKRTKKDTCCCDKKIFNVREEVCCEGKVNELIESGNRKGTVCCGQKVFNPESQICCEGNVYDLFEDANTVCCEKKAYNADRQKCVNGTIEDLTGLCGPYSYDEDKQICCNGWIQDKPSDNNTRCCYDMAYDARKKVCCCNGHMQEAFAGLYTQCCYSFGYDSRKAICCDGQVTKKPVPSADCCCLRQAYDSDRQICCGGKVRSRCVGLFTKCCGTEAYDPGYKICCDGKLYNRTYGHNTYCCGKEIYTPSMSACCGKRIAYRRKMKMEW